MRESRWKKSVHLQNVYYNISQTRTFKANVLFVFHRTCPYPFFVTSGFDAPVYFSQTEKRRVGVGRTRVDKKNRRSTCHSNETILSWLPSRNRDGANIKRALAKVHFQCIVSGRKKINKSRQFGAYFFVSRRTNTDYNWSSDEERQGLAFGRVRRLNGLTLKG